MNNQYTYFGARYYDSDLSVWLSVDPLADKYPSMSPFMYVRGNPIMLVDPNGLYDSDSKINRKINKYERKANRIAKENDWDFNNEQDREKIHKAMHDKYKNRKFMYIKREGKNNSMDVWTTTSSEYDVKMNLTNTKEITESGHDKRSMDFGNTRKELTKQVSFNHSGESGTSTLSLVNKDDIDYNFSITSDGQEIASGNLKVAPISFTYTVGNIYNITYSPSDPRVFMGEIGDLRNAWARPAININWSWNSTRTIIKSPILNSTSFTKGAPFSEVVNYFGEFYK